MTRTIKKFKHWEQTLIYSTLEKAMQVKLGIHDMCFTNKTNPKDLPPSIVPTEVLYDICSCYEALFEKLLKNDLLSAGYPKSNPTIKH